MKAAGEAYVTYPSPDLFLTDFTCLHSPPILMNTLDFDLATTLWSSLTLLTVYV